MAEPSDGTFSAFQDKHPPVPSDFLHLLHLLRHLSPYVSEVEVARAIRSFPLGSLVGPNGLRPQHLKDMLLQSLLPSFLRDRPLLPCTISFSVLASLLWIRVEEESVQ